MDLRKIDMARNSKLFNEYKESQKGMNVGLTYENWLEDRVCDSRRQHSISILIEFQKFVKNDSKGFFEIGDSTIDRFIKSNL